MAQSFSHVVNKWLWFKKKLLSFFFGFTASAFFVIQEQHRHLEDLTMNFREKGFITF